MSRIPNQDPGAGSYNPYMAGQPTTGYPSGHVTDNSGDATGGLIPYKNPAALFAYYLGLFSLFPVLGLLLAIPAFVLGIIGLRKRKRNPAIKGSIHAWIGIVMGFLMTLLWGFVVMAIIVAAVTSRR